MTRLSHRFALDRLTTLQRKIRAMTIEVFGHEGTQDAELVDYSYCPELKKHTYRVSSIRLNQLAVKKLLNPLRHLKFLQLALLAFINSTRASMNKNTAPTVKHSTARIFEVLNQPVGENRKAIITTTYIEKDRTRQVLTLFVFYRAWRYFAKSKQVYRLPPEDLCPSLRGARRATKQSSF